MSTSAADNSKSYMPLAGIAKDGWSTETEATATCFCGAVQLAFPIQGEGFLGTFVCNCSDCRKITASMFASNFTVLDSHLRYIRGRENLKTFAQAHTIGSKQMMTNFFCSTCGTLMNRVGARFPGQNFLRIGTVDDFSLHKTKLRPAVEQFTKDRVAWLRPLEGVEGLEGLKSFEGMSE